ncbi:MAG: hypothetical protein ABR506_02605 [Candidatus Krumholzibacteriia bacterium]
MSAMFAPMDGDDKRNQDDGPPDADRALEDEIRRERPFGLAEALGRAGAGALKGASPVARTQQLLLGIRRLLETRLADPEGSLTRTILARLEADPPLLSSHADDAAAALASFLDGVLGPPGALADLVRDADARWGREYAERPHFEQGEAPHPDDPYTEAGVRSLLEDLHRGI